ncbi:hypothetical protein TraAM80_10140, partial [Trypanosoma rangeli]
MFLPRARLVVKAAPELRDCAEAWRLRWCEGVVWVRCVQIVVSPEELPLEPTALVLLPVAVRWATVFSCMSTVLVRLQSREQCVVWSIDDAGCFLLFTLLFLWSPRKYCL